MSNRTLLRNQLAAAWHATILHQYQDQKINSEHGLQVYFCTALLHFFERDGVKHRLFVEPRLCIKDASESRYPDVVICNSRNVIGIVELKYAPRGIPDFSKDLATLEFAAINGRELSIQNERYLGNQKFDRQYLLSQDAVLCWAGVYTGARLDLPEKLKWEIRPHFLQLDALTAENNEPIVYADGLAQAAQK